MKKKLVFTTVSGLVLIALGIILLALVKNRDINEFLCVFKYLMAGLCIIGGSAFIIIGIRDSLDDKIFDNEEIFTTGEIVSTQKSDGVTYVYIRYFDSDGNEHFVEDYFMNGIHRKGDKIDVRYAKRKNGKFIARAVDQ